MRFICLLLALLLAACATTPAAAPASLNTLAEEYVRLQLAIGEKEAGYIDAYYGPAEWQAAAKADGQAATLPQLAERVRSLKSRVGTVDVSSLEPLERRRKAFLLAQLTAAETRLRMLQGEKLSFADEARGLFGTVPELQPLSSLDPALARLEALVPGQEPLSERMENYANRFVIPTDRLKPVFDAAIAECKRRTLRHIRLPEGERFDMSFVTGKSWSGYNYYQGDYHSRIEINTDLPIRIGRAVDLGCHEGYPGHHALNVLLEQRLVDQRGWVEFSVYPLYSPQSLIAEGTANYGIDLAFPGEERIAFETQILYPLAGLPVAEAQRYADIQQAALALGGSRFTIARDYLDGRITRQQAIELTQRYGLVSRARAEQSISFTDQYRTYVINYGHGQDLARAYVERAGASPEARWAAFERAISEPTLPSDLMQ